MTSDLDQDDTHDWHDTPLRRECRQCGVTILPAHGRAVVWPRTKRVRHVLSDCGEEAAIQTLES